MATDDDLCALDRCIAEAMGWKQVAAIDYWRDHEGSPVGFHEWEPSSDIADAFRVVEFMRERGWLVQMWQNENGSWDVFFRTYFGADPFMSLPSVNDTVTIAISKAALAALAQEKTDAE